MASVISLMVKTALLLIIFPLQGYVQDFTGVWSGFIITSGNQLPYELVISGSNENLKAYSLTVFSINGVENTGIKSMKVKARKKQLSIEDDALLYNDYTTAGRKLTLYSTLSLDQEDTTWILQGTFFTRSVDRSSFKGTIRLQKKESVAETRLTAQLKQMGLFSGLVFSGGNPGEERVSVSPSLVQPASPIQPGDNDSSVREAPAKAVNQSDRAVLDSRKKDIRPVAIPVITNAKPAIAPIKAAAEISSRKTEVIRNIFFQSDSLVLSLYDNGEVDGDTVSVVLNDEIVIARLGLTTTSISITYHIPENTSDSLRLIMYAENLGRIPPNTGVLVIQDGDARHQVRFEGDYKKNSAVILRRKKL